MPPFLEMTWKNKKRDVWVLKFYCTCVFSAPIELCFLKYILKKMTSDNRLGDSINSRGLSFFSGIVFHHFLCVLPSQRSLIFRWSIQYCTNIQAKRSDFFYLPFPVLCGCRLSFWHFHIIFHLHLILDLLLRSVIPFSDVIRFSSSSSSHQQIIYIFKIHQLFVGSAI